MKKRFLAFFGHFNIDVTMRVPFLPSNGSVNVISENESFGGTAGNFSIVASHLGIPFIPVSAVSRRSHSEFLQFLKELKVDLTDIVVREDSFGPVCYSVSDGNEQVYYVNQGPMGIPFTSELNDDWSSFQYLHFGTGPPEDYLDVLENSQGSIKVFDPGQEISYRYTDKIIMDFIKSSDITFLNSHELEKIVSITGVEMDELFSLGKVFIITKGIEGVEVRNGDQLTKVRSRKVLDIYDTLGAGDAFRAGFYMGLNENLDYADAAVIGNIVASEAIKRPIPKFDLTHDDITEIFENEKDDLIL
ncbi:MAG: carbohydrate kinase family protein [Candidatus Thermoplasmatota archaeon]|nr:carbohydrate kinase family protein [Candidatus Thermoplasmatota archaeon]